MFKKWNYVCFQGDIFIENLMLGNLHDLYFLSNPSISLVRLVQLHFIDEENEDHEGSEVIKVLGDWRQQLAHLATTSDSDFF